jgi:hypothetical protein
MGIHPQQRFGPDPEMRNEFPTTNSASLLFATDNQTFDVLTYHVLQKFVFTSAKAKNEYTT